MFDKKQTLKVKGVAILMLIFHHLFYSEQRIMAIGIQFFLLRQETVMTIATGMRICVWIFAFLSAYGLTIQYERLGDDPKGSEVTVFFVKRWLALMKPYWIVLALVVFLCVVLDYDLLSLFGGEIKGVLAGALGLSDFFGLKMPVAAWWYMTFAQIVILLIPFLSVMCRRFGAVVLVASFLLMPYLGDGIVSPYGGSYLNYLYVVIMGVLCAQYGIMEKLGKKSDYWFVRCIEIVVICVAILGCVWINMNYASTDSWRYTKLFMSVGAILTCLIVYKYITWKPLEYFLQYLGKYSGGIFLIHAFGYTYFSEMLFFNRSASAVYAVLLAFSLVSSVFCDRLLFLTNARKR